MEYFFYATNAWCDLDKIKPYIARFYNNGIVAKVVFNDDNYNDFSKDYELNEAIEKDGKFQTFGIDGYFYNVTLSGAIKGDKYPAYMPKLIQFQQYHMYKSYHSDVTFKEKALKDNKYGNTEKISNGLKGFDKHLYINKDSGVVIPYRFKKANGKNKPLVVYFSGVETIGHDNFKPLAEFLFYSAGNKIMKRDCNILIPQNIRAWSNGDTENILRDRYTDNCAVLIKELVKEHNIDSKRIYVYGMSFGGGCVWNALLNSPDLYTAAVETVGEYMNYKSLSDSDFEAITNTPIWMAHSSNDSIVNIASDDYFYDKLKSLGANVKYTRWDKHGHAMAGKFFKNEPWVEWLFEQSK